MYFRFLCLYFKNTIDLLGVKLKKVKIDIVAVKNNFDILNKILLMFNYHMLCLYLYFYLISEVYITKYFLSKSQESQLFYKYKSLIILD